MERDRNESGQYADGIDPETVLDVVDAREDLGRPVTAGDVVDELGIARRTAHNKLGALVERGVLETRKIGARVGCGGDRSRPTASIHSRRETRDIPRDAGGDERDQSGGASTRRARPMLAARRPPRHSATSTFPRGGSRRLQ